MKIDYQINKVEINKVDKKVTEYHLDRIDSDKGRIVCRNVIVGTESECLRRLAEIKEGLKKEGIE